MVASLFYPAAQQLHVARRNNVKRLGCGRDKDALALLDAYAVAAVIGHSAVALGAYEDNERVQVGDIHPILLGQLAERCSEVTACSQLHLGIFLRLVVCAVFEESLPWVPIYEGSCIDMSMSLETF